MLSTSGSGAAAASPTASLVIILIHQHGAIQPLPSRVARAARSTTISKITTSSSIPPSAVSSLILNQMHFRPGVTNIPQVTGPAKFGAKILPALPKPRPARITSPTIPPPSAKPTGPSTASKSTVTPALPLPLLLPRPRPRQHQRLHLSLHSSQKPRRPQLQPLLTPAPLPQGLFLLAAQAPAVPRARTLPRAAALSELVAHLEGGRYKRSLSRQEKLAPRPLFKVLWSQDLRSVGAGS